MQSDSDFGNMKVPLKAFMDVLRIPTSIDQKNIVYPLVSTILKQRLNKENVDMDSLTGHQVKFHNQHELFFNQLQELSSLEVAQRTFLGKVFSDVGDSLKAGRSPYIVGGESNAIFAKDYPDDNAFLFSDSEEKKIHKTRKFLDENTDGVVYSEMQNTVPRGQIFGGKTQFVRYHLFVLGDKSGNGNESKISVNF